MLTDFLRCMLVISNYGKDFLNATVVIKYRGGPHDKAGLGKA